MSRPSAAGISCSLMRTPQLIEQRLRSSLNPECISAAALRAQARASGSAGQIPGCRSARYSAMASESQTTVSPSMRHGTLPLGHSFRKLSQRDASPKRSKRSVNSIPRSRMSTHGRSDHDE